MIKRHLENTDKGRDKVSDKARKAEGVKKL